MIQKKNSFLKFDLNPLILKSLNSMGYTHPSPIQQLCIPYLLLGKDVLGMAQTGSGKTAAFALPLLNNIISSINKPQILVLTPTRELAIQVAHAFKEFSKYITNIKVLPLYGGQRYDLQLRILKQGPQIVVGTPGRLLDHLKRKTLNLFYLKSLVLDEADEMLRMGFIEDVENIMSQIPKKHQTALFSATMPSIIRKIAYKFMNSPKEIKIKSNIKTRPNIQQSYWIVKGRKTDGLIKFLEYEDFSATIIFVRTKYATLEVSEVLEKHGYNSAALNGDMNQNLREKTLERLKSGKLDILIATDIAARGLDVDRVSLVINYDIPLDVESYIHRIGRTGRAGRPGKALLFVEYREKKLLKNIEKIIHEPIVQIELPNAQLISKCRIQNFYKKLLNQLNSKDLLEYCKLLPQFNPDNKFSLEMLSAALLKIAQGERPLIISEPYYNKKNYLKTKYSHEKKNTTSVHHYKKKFMTMYRIEVGYNSGVEVRHIVGAIANEGNIDSKNIGIVKIFDEFSTIELSSEFAQEVLKNCINTRILNKPICMKLYNTNYKKKYHNNYNNLKLYKKSI